MASSLRLTDRSLAALAVLALFVELWLLVSDVHFIWRPAVPTVPRHAVASIDQVGSRVLVRTPLQLSWVEASNEQQLYEGDEVATLDGSTARITFTDAEQLTLGPNSLLSVRRVRSVGKPVFKLALVRGSIFQNKPAEPAAAPEKRFEIEVGGRKLLAGGGDGFSLTASARGEAQAPPPRVASTVPAALEAPHLLSPGADSLIINPDHVRLSWAQRSPGVPLTLEVARDAAFSRVVARQRVDGQSSWLFRPEAKGQFHWRVVAHGEQGRTAFSEPRRFQIERELEMPRLNRPEIETDAPQKAEKLEAPRLRKPSVRYQPGASLALKLLDAIASLVSTPASAAEPSPAPPPGVAPDDVHTRYGVKLSWYAVPGAHAYTLQISTEPVFRHMVAEKILTEPSYMWRTNIAGFYYWRVSAVDAEGDRGPFSEFMTFDIKADRNLPGDETTYETFLKFDEYAGHEHRFRLLGGPEYTSYKFTSSSGISPNDASYHELVARLAQLEYEYRLDNHYSIELAARTMLAHLTGANFPNEPGQHGLNQNETNIWLGAERRFFGPHHYYSLEGAIRISLIDLPTGPPTGQLQLSTFNFVGLQFLGSYHRPIGRSYEVSLGAGPVLMYGSQSSWYGFVAREQVSKSATDILSIGLRFEQEGQFFNFEADNLAGSSTRMRYDGFVFLEFNF